MGLDEVGLEYKGGIKRQDIWVSQFVGGKLLVAGGAIGIVPKPKSLKITKEMQQDKNPDFPGRSTGSVLKAATVQLFRALWRWQTDGLKDIERFDRLVFVTKNQETTDTFEAEKAAAQESLLAFVEELSAKQSNKK